MTLSGVATGVARVLLLFVAAVAIAANEMDMNVTPDVHPIEPKVRKPDLQMS